MHSRRTDDGDDQPDGAELQAKMSLRRWLRLIGVLNLVTAGLLLLIPTVAVAIVEEDGEAELWLPVVLFLMSVPAVLHVVAGVNCLWGRERVGLGFSIGASLLVLTFVVELGSEGQGFSIDGLLVFVAWLAWFGTILGLSIYAIGRSRG